MNNLPYSIEKARKQANQNWAIAYINAKIEVASCNNKFEVEINLKHEVPKENMPDTSVSSLRGEAAAMLLNPAYREALAMFRREGYGIQYRYDAHLDQDPYNGGWERTYSVIINW